MTDYEKWEMPTSAEAMLTVEKLELLKQIAALAERIAELEEKNNKLKTAFIEITEQGTTGEDADVMRELAFEILNGYVEIE